LSKLQHYGILIMQLIWAPLCILDHRLCCLQAVIPRSSQPGRIWENNALDFELSVDAMQSIDDMADTLD